MKDLTKEFEQFIETRESNVTSIKRIYKITLTCIDFNSVLGQIGVYMEIQAESWEQAEERARREYKGILAIEKGDVYGFLKQKEERRVA